jgi:LuxR family maltose regulon positive regulatory protein
LISLGDIYREWNEFEKAIEYLQNGKELIKQFGEIGSILADLSLARIKEAQGEYQAADQIMEKTEEIALQFDATTMDDRLVICYRNNLWLLQGDMHRIKPWAAKIHADFSRLFSKETLGSSFQSMIDPVTSFEGLILAKILIYQKNYQAALEILETIRTVERHKRRMRTVVKTMVYMSMAYFLAGQKTKANAIFQEALQRAEPEGYHRTFLDEGHKVWDLLLEAQANQITHNYASTLLGMERLRGDNTSQERTEPDLLTKREKEILRLIEKGYTNKEIAQELFLAVNTIKGYTRRIFTKLDAQNRAHALSRARELGIKR